MESKAKLFGHSIHQMLIPFPLGLLTTGAIFDVAHVLTGSTTLAVTSFYMIVVGVIGGLVAAVFGLIDFLEIPSGTRARRIGTIHGLGNVLMVGLFALGLFFRWSDRATPPIPAVVLSVAGALLGVLTGWLGGELVDRLGVGVDEGANLNAPSSLSGPVVRERPAAAD